MMLLPYIVELINAKPSPPILQAQINVRTIGRDIVNAAKPSATVKHVLEV